MGTALTNRGGAAVRRIGFLVLITSLLGVYPLSVLAWTPPVGVPAPQWPANLDVARPALPSPWTSEHAGFYYIDPNGCSDSQTYGYPGASRCSLPTSPSPGSVIALNGTISGNKTINYSGTSASPIWIMGYNPSSKPTLTSNWNFSGSYVIWDSLAWSYNVSDGIGLGGSYLMVRDSTLANPYDSSNGSGFGIVGTKIVFYRNTISEMGNWLYTGGTDIDRHGIKVVGGASDIWIVDSTFYHCHGDGVQVGDQNNTPSQINRVYVGRNTAYENYQFGFWTKNATDVIFSQNVAYNLKTASASGPAGGLGGQYDAQYVWFLLNKVYNSNTGIHVASASSGGGPWYMIGNLIYAVGTGSCNNYDGGALGWRNRGDVTMLFNTVHDVDMFVAVPTGSVITVKDNIFSSKRNTGCSALAVDVAFTHDYNLFSASGYDPGSEAHKVTADPRFVNAAAADFSLQATSPAINAANPSEEAAFASFQARYGIDIRKDIASTTRPQSTLWDIGAYESLSGRSLRIPNPPTNIYIQ